MKILVYATALALLAGCSSSPPPKSTEEIENTTYNCSDVDQKIAMLKKEKEENDKRVLAGVKSIVPISAIINLVKGDYGTNFEIATGKWGEVLDEEITKMEAFKSQC